MGFLIMTNCHCNYFAGHLQGTKRIGLSPRILQSKKHGGFGANLKAYENRKSLRKQRKAPRGSKLLTSEEYGSLLDRSSRGIDCVPEENVESSKKELDQQYLGQSRRSAVLQACYFTSSSLLILGTAIRQVSHIAFTQGWEILDSSTEVSFDFEMWDLALIIGLIILISSCRYLLLKLWPEFAESSVAANKQVLSSLQPLDYAVVAFLPGISEEFLFRGALLPLLGFSWESALAVGALFGVLHLCGGRKYPFAIWATFVGFAYGFATIITSSVVVAMTAHSLNNLVGGILWHYSSTSGKD